LNAIGKSIRIGSRHESPAFDWDNAATWNEALNGIHSVYITFQPDLAVPGARDTIKSFTSLAIKNGVQKLVLLSGRGEKEAQECEQIVINSGADYTIVRCDWFSQNFSESFFLDPIRAGYVALPRAETLNVVVSSLTGNKHSNKIYELTGPRLITFQQAVEEIAVATKRDIVFTSVSIDDYLKMLREYRVPEDHIWLVNYLFTEALDGRNASITSDLEKALGRKPKDFSAYVNETSATGVWQSIE
jgi:uncharacterized protein YbjT (DUF2867 family)